MEVGFSVPVLSPLMRINRTRLRYIGKIQLKNLDFNTLYRGRYFRLVKQPEKIGLKEYQSPNFPLQLKSW